MLSGWQRCCRRLTGRWGSVALAPLPPRCFRQQQHRPRTPQPKKATLGLATPLCTTVYL